MRPKCFCSSDFVITVPLKIVDGFEHCFYKKIKPLLPA